jgi:hypothetical protein
MTPWADQGSLEEKEEGEAEAGLQNAFDCWIGVLYSIKRGMLCMYNVKDLSGRRKNVV